MPLLPSPVRYSRALFLSALAVLASQGQAIAQERLELFTFVNNQSRAVEMDATVSGFGSVRAITPIDRLPPVPDPPQASDAVAVAGGRYLAWGGSSLVAFDRRTRLVIDAGSLIPAGLGALAGIRIAATDSHQPRLFVRGDRWPAFELWTIDLRGGAPVRLATSSLPVSDAAYAADTDELFYLEVGFEANARITWVVAVNATTGHELRRWKLTGIVTAIRTDATGRVVWVDHNGLEALDGATGVVLATSSQFNAANTTVDEPRQLLLVRQGDFLVAVDPLLLTEIGRTRVTFMPPDQGMIRAAQTLPGRWMTGAYTVRTETRATLVSYGRTGREDRYEFTCNAIDVDALHPDGARRETADVLARLGPGGGTVGTREQASGCRAVAVLVRSPFAPTSLAAAVTGNNVSLSWKDPGDTTAFEIEFGFAPGQRAGSMKVGRNTSIGIPGVPPGVYFVRVKGANEVGPSPASNELRIVVQ